MLRSLPRPIRFIPWSLVLLSWGFHHSAAHDDMVKPHLDTRLFKRYDNTTLLLAPLYGPTGRPERSDFEDVTPESWIESVLLNAMDQQVQGQDLNGTVTSQLMGVHGQMQTYQYDPVYAPQPKPVWFPALVKAANELIASESQYMGEGPPFAPKTARLLNAIYGKSGFADSSDCGLVQDSPNNYTIASSRPLLAWAWDLSVVVLPDTTPDTVPLRLVNTSMDVRVDLPPNIPFAVSLTWGAGKHFQAEVDPWKENCKQLLYLH